MLELIYALYKEQTIEEIIYTMIAETIYYKYGQFINGKLEINGKDYPKRICNILERIKTGETIKISWKDIVHLKEYFLKELESHGYIKKWPIVGYVKSLKLKKDIKKNIETLEPSIKKYIECGDKNYLVDIFKEISNISLVFPEYDGFGSFYKDSQDAYQGYLDVRAGIQRDYSEYYTVSNKKKKIK